MIDLVNARFLLKIKASQMSCSAFENPLSSTWLTSFANGAINHPKLTKQMWEGGGGGGKGGRWAKCLFLSSNYNILTREQPCTIYFIYFLSLRKINLSYLFSQGAVGRPGPVGQTGSKGSHVC